MLNVRLKTKSQKKICYSLCPKIALEGYMIMCGSRKLIPPLPTEGFGGGEVTPYPSRNHNFSPYMSLKMFAFVPRGGGGDAWVSCSGDW